MAEINKILVVASASMDMLLRVKKVPRQGELAEESIYKYVPGGAGLNTSLFLRKFNYEPVLCARVGTDANGKWVTETMRKSGLDTRCMRNASGVATGMSFVIAPENEANRTIYYSNANEKLTADDVLDAYYCCPDAVFVQLTMPKSAVETAIDSAQRKNLPLIIYTGSNPKMFNIAKIGKCSVFITNQEAVNLLTGIYDFKYENMVSVGVELARHFQADCFVIKLNNGNTLIYNNVSVKLHTPPVSGQTAYDPITAFDAFAAAVTAEYLDSFDIERASRFGGIIEAMAKLGEGSSKSLPKDVNAIRQFIFDNEIPYDL